MMIDKPSSVRVVLAKMGLSVTLIGTLAGCGGSDVIGNPPPTAIDAGQDAGPQADAGDGGPIIGNPPADAGDSGSAADAGEDGGPNDGGDSGPIIGNPPADAG